MRCINFLWIALALSQGPAQGHLAIYCRYQSARMLRSGQTSPITSLNQELTATHRLHQLTIAHRHLEAHTAQLNLELQELIAKRHHAHEQLEGPWNQDECKCENANAVTFPTSSPIQPSESEVEDVFTGNESWHLEPTKFNSSDSGLTDDMETSSGHHGSFLSTTVFALAVFFMVIPAACVIGFVLFCKRRRRQQFTHA